MHSSTFSVRLAREDLQLPSSSGRPVDLRKGDTILVANMAGHFDDDCFDNADEFRPNRFVQLDGTFGSSPHLRPWGGGIGAVRGKDGEQADRAVQGSGLCAVQRGLRLST